MDYGYELFEALCCENYNFCIPKYRIEWDNGEHRQILDANNSLIKGWVSPKAVIFIKKFILQEKKTESELEELYLSAVSKISVDKIYAIESFKRLMTSIYEREFIIEGSIHLEDDFEEYKSMMKLDIEGFPKTFETFQKHKIINSEKYQQWKGITRVEIT